MDNIESMKKTTTEAASQQSRIAVSVVVPVYNTGAYLKECVKSIEAQTFKDFELIIIDDGSTDDSGALCDRLAEQDARIRAVHQKNQGLAAVRNNGIDLAQGEFILFIDSDDFIEPEMLSELYGAAKKDDADIVMCRHRELDEAHNPLVTHGVDTRCVLGSLEATAKILEDRKIKNYVWNKIFRRSLFSGIRFPINRNYEDIATTYKLVAKANKFVCIPYVGYNYIRQSASITKTKRYSEKWLKNQIDVLWALLDRFYYVKADDRFAHLVPFCAGKVYHKCLRTLDTCHRHGISIPQDWQDEIMQGKKAVEGDLQHLPSKIMRDIWIVKTRILLSHILRMHS